MWKKKLLTLLLASTASSMHVFVNDNGIIRKPKTREILEAHCGKKPFDFKNGERFDFSGNLKIFFEEQSGKPSSILFDNSQNPEAAFRNQKYYGLRINIESSEGNGYFVVANNPNIKVCAVKVKLKNEKAAHYFLTDAFYEREGNGFRIKPSILTPDSKIEKKLEHLARFRRHFI
jgi:hypothetical protein